MASNLWFCVSLPGVKTVTLPRYFIRLSYLGTSYNGWQRQPQTHTATVQQIIEDTLSVFLPFSVTITGCGRTDTGVHARDYMAHWDTPIILDTEEIMYKANKMLPADIAIQDIFQVKEQTHARFDALSRSYEYKLHIRKDPFAHQSYYYTYDQPDTDILHQAAKLLLRYNDFYTFCKEHTDVKTTLCHISSCQWTESDGQYIFRITADRFLRGMIRLIVGMCLDVARKKLSLAEVEDALNRKVRLDKNWSVPAEGLTLCDIRYDEDAVRWAESPSVP